MSDYLYLLENHLSAAQNKVAALFETAASAAHQTLYLTGGAIRDLLGGFPTRDLDFTLCGNPRKLNLAAIEEAGGCVIRKDELRNLLQFQFADGATVKISMARTERYSKPGGKPQIVSSDIREDLQRRDFTVNAIALGLNRSAKGMLADPSNGLADLASRELRTTNSGAFADEPGRLARLIRFKHRLNFTVAERTERQFQNACDADLQRLITPACWFEELCAWGDEAAPSVMLHELEERGVLNLPGLNYAAVQKWEKLKRSVPLPGRGWAHGWRSLYLAMTEGAAARGKAGIAAGLGLAQESNDSLKKLAVRARKLETAISAPSVKRPADFYQIVEAFAPDEILFALSTSAQRVVQDRLRTTLQKHLPIAVEMRGSPEAEILRKLNEKPKKPDADLTADD